MILEDLHWADDSTLSLLDHLMQRLADLPLMVIGTYRDAELNVTRPLAKTLEDLHRGRLATSVRLKGLPRDEVAAMLNGLSGKSPPDAVVGEVFAETEGNPFFVEELFRYLEEENRLYDSAGQFRSDLKIGELDAPPSVRLVVARRLARHHRPDAEDAREGGGDRALLHVLKSFKLRAQPMRIRFWSASRKPKKGNWFTRLRTVPGPGLSSPTS